MWLGQAVDKRDGPVISWRTLAASWLINSSVPPTNFRAGLLSLLTYLNYHIQNHHNNIACS